MDNITFEVLNKKEVFYFFHKDNGFVKTKGNLVIMGEIEGFLHKIDNMWYVNESKTGRNITWGATKKDAIKKIEELINTKYDSIKGFVDKLMMEVELSPKYVN